MDISVINFVVPTGSGFGWFLAQSIAWLAQVTSSIALAVILFTLALKLITLPFDIHSRISMRKNSLKMEEMRPELEKLQKQYAGDKNLYNQKMMALYKKNGYSMFGACLPVIVTMVIFIIAIQGFNDYSSYQNRMYVHDMSVSYSKVIYDGISNDEYVYYDEAGEKFVLNNEKLLAEVPATVGQVKNIDDNNDDVVTKIERTGDNQFAIYNDGGYTKVLVSYSTSGEKTLFEAPRFQIIEGSLSGRTFTVGNEEKVTLKYDEMKTANAELTEKQFIEEVCATASALTFRENITSFLWVKNIWVADSAMAHPISEDMSGIRAVDSCGSCGCSSCSCTSLDSEGWKENDTALANYKKLISKLDKEQSEPNGYFILVILTAGISLLMQIITSKSQKAQAELQTVDGQGAMQQKMMMWMMPIMMALFAFWYTAAFSIYIILSSTISIITTLIINYVIKKKFDTVKATQKQVTRGRIYIPKEEPKKEKPKKVKKDKNEIPDNDFLSGKADRKKPRGRLK